MITLVFRRISNMSASQAEFIFANRVFNENEIEMKICQSIFRLQIEKIRRLERI